MIMAVLYWSSVELYLVRKVCTNTGNGGNMDLNNLLEEYFSEYDNVNEAI